VVESEELFCSPAAEVEVYKGKVGDFEAHCVVVGLTGSGLRSECSEAEAGEQMGASVRERDWEGSLRDNFMIYFGH